MPSMATILHNDRAPNDVEVTYSLGSAEPFALQGADASFEVAEPDEDAAPEERAAYDALVANAQTHPWLRVEVPEASGEDLGRQVDVDFPKTAIDAGLDQNEVEYEGEDAEVPIAETTAADQAQGDEPIVTDPADDEEPVDPAQE